MPNVVRFTLSTARDLFVPGAGMFRAGVLDVDANDLEQVSRARYLVQPYRAVEVGIIDASTPYPSLPAVPAPPGPDPYPQYLSDDEAETRFLTAPSVDPLVAGKVGDPASDTSVALGTAIDSATHPLGVAARAAFGTADPVLSDFVYDPATGNLLSYKEDGVPIVLTYNADGTVATSKRGSASAKTFTYSGGNLAGVA